MKSIELPRIGMGTWQLRGSTCTKILIEGLKLGYRFIDTAQAYHNEQYVGDAIEASEIPRDEIVLATKLWISKLSPRRVHSSFEKSLKKLKTNYVDILYIHWPAGKYDPDKTLPAMNELVENGKVKHIGVSNFTIPLLKEAIEKSENPILANQVEMHPGLGIHKLHQFNQSQNIYTIAYSPLGRGNIWKNPILKEIAQNHGITVPQVCIAYVLHRDAIPIPKASSKQHLKENLDALSMTLDDNEIKHIDTLPKRRFLSPPFAPHWDKND
ncbi:MAG: aldo/keto reductase [Candidatus Lokiarchaeota archaeon]|nr:aldo/keto reductase [Candidatus Lokiarchaeota archaeon]